PQLSGEIGAAAWRGDVSRVEAFLKDDSENANALWTYGTRPLQWACNGGNLPIVKMLLKNGAMVNPPPTSTNELKSTLFVNRYFNSVSAESNRLFIGGSSARLSGSSTNFPWRDPYLTLSPLQLALANGHTEVAEYLIRHGARVDLASAASLGR